MQTQSNSHHSVAISFVMVLFVDAAALAAVIRCY